jgi:hypothetical protein
VKTAIRRAEELGRALVMAPERWVSALDDDDDGICLGELVEERRVRVEVAPSSLVIDTTHARDGWLDIPSAMRATEPAKSAKKAAVEGDLVVSRLRPYLRQLALIHPRVLAESNGRTLALSTEFYVLSPREEGASLAFLLPHLLSEPVQARLAAAQEGGHHPRVPRESLFALKIPVQIVEERSARSRQVLQALDSLYEAFFRYHALAAPRSR